jgi:hypothetical protein
VADVDAVIVGEGGGVAVSLDLAVTVGVARAVAVAVLRVDIACSWSMLALILEAVRGIVAVVSR